MQVAGKGSSGPFKGMIAIYVLAYLYLYWDYCKGLYRELIEVFERCIYVYKWGCVGLLVRSSGCSVVVAVAGFAQTRFICLTRRERGDVGDVRHFGLCAQILFTLSGSTSPKL